MIWLSACLVSSLSVWMVTPLAKQCSLLIDGAVTVSKLLVLCLVASRAVLVLCGTVRLTVSMLTEVEK